MNEQITVLIIYDVSVHCFMVVQNVFGVRITIEYMHRWFLP